jgi:hypothetical protein
MVNLIMGESFAVEDAPQAAMRRRKSGARMFTKLRGAETGQLSPGAIFASFEHS